LNKKPLIVALAMLLLLPVFVEPVAAYNVEVKIPNVDELRYASMAEPEASDPAWAYDTSSTEMIMNVYETLIFWPYEEVPIDPHQFEPMLATEWVLPGDPEYPGISPSAPAGTVESWYFKTRTGVLYHDDLYGSMSPADVEYSIERAMVFDHVNGPQWMFYFPLLNASGSFDWDLTDPAQVNALGQLVNSAVQVGNGTHVGTGYKGMPNYVENADRVIFNLAVSYQPFIQILAQSLASVYPLQWGVDLYEAGRFVWPGWNYTGGAGNYDNWINFNDKVYPQLLAPFDNPTTVMVGTGPYRFRYWKKVVTDPKDPDYPYSTYQLMRFGGYWKRWPDPSSASYFKFFTHKLVPSWPDRRFLFLSNLADKQVDIADVPRAHIGEVEGEPGVRGVKDLPSLLLSPAMLFNYQVRSDAIYFTTKPRLGKGGGVEKLDLFSDKHMRKAFAHALDYATYLVNAFLGEALQPATPIIKGLAQYNATKEKYHYSMALVQAELQLAWEGWNGSGTSAWNDGFYAPLSYWIGTERQVACDMIKDAIENIPGVHGTFSVDAFGLPWSTFDKAWRRGELTVFFARKEADYADADNFVVPFMHSTMGTYVKSQSVNYTNINATDFAANSGRADPATGMYRNWEGKAWNIDVSGLNNTYVDTLIEQAARGDPEQRLAMYSELEDVYYAATPSVPLAQPKARYWERDWMQGWYYNAIGLGGCGVYVYRVWKGLDADTNGDGEVDGTDITPINNFYWDAFWDPMGNQWVIISGPAGRYNRVADISSPFITGGQSRTWELDGTEILWGHYSWDPANPSIPCSKPIAGYEIPGVDGYVNIFDQALVSAQLYDYVTPY